MTGFGRKESVIQGRQISVEIRSLNGKSLELNTRVSSLLRPYELDIRSIVGNILIRGTIDISVVIKQDGATRPMSVNTDLAVAYFRSMREIAQKTGVPEDNVLSTLMRMPEVVAQDTEVLEPEAWEEVKQLVVQAAEALMQHRADEGKALSAELNLRIDNITQQNDAVAPLEAPRMERIRSRIKGALRDSGIVGADENRFEQELTYYLEKIDFTEERVRLAQHCIYFKEIIENDEVSSGKKLGFILQEVGREINTLGSKANDAAIQKIIVQMKDELEKAKEQVLNVL